MHTQASDQRKREYTVDTVADLRFFPEGARRLIHVPVKVSLPGSPQAAR